MCFSLVVVDEVKEERGTILMIIVRIGLMRKWWATAEDAIHFLPKTLTRHAPSDCVDDDEEERPDDNAPRQLRAAEAEVTKRRKGFRNTLEFTAAVYADEYKMRKMTFINALHKPNMEEVSVALQRTMTKVSVFNQNQILRSSPIPLSGTPEANQYGTRAVHDDATTPQETPTQ